MVLVTPRSAAAVNGATGGPLKNVFWFTSRLILPSGTLAPVDTRLTDGAGDSSPGELVIGHID